MSLTRNIESVQIIVRVPKTESAFTYFTLEANEGICFYSTLPFRKGDSFRDLELITHTSLEDELRKIIKTLKKQCNLEIINEY